MTDPHGDHAELLIGDDALLDAVRAGDSAAYAVLYERHDAAARGLARQLVRGESEVDDVVAETFTRVLSVVRRGGGPRDGFRPYLLTALRHVAYDRTRGERRQVATDDMETFDSGEPFVDPALEGLERSLIARAFLSLPERWQAVLWHTEIEGVRPAEAAPLLGMTPNSVAALAYRAREGLRQAYLQMHLAGGAAAEACRPALRLLGAYVRGGLAKRDTAVVDTHLDGCGRCREVCAELMDVNVGLRGIVLPLFAGPAAGGYLAALPAGAPGAGWWGRMSRSQRQATAAGTAATAVAAAAALALVNDGEPLRPPPTAPPAAAPERPAAPAPGPPPAPPAPQGPGAPDPRPPGPRPAPPPERPAAAPEPGRP
uniref:sigma-70 family RNA polymerase sigma factor n=1 Tax=Nocardiopsis trehalosi TaxID=109329 RepID=UPI000A3FDC87